MNPNETFHHKGEMDDRIMFGYDPLSVDVYVEMVDVTEAVAESGGVPDGVGANEHYWSVGVHDRTVGSHPTIPESMGRYATVEEMTNHLLGVALDLGAIVRRYRASADYRRAKEVERRAPPYSESGSAPDTIPEFHLRQQQNAVIGGRKTPDEAVAYLYDEYEDA